LKKQGNKTLPISHRTSKINFKCTEITEMSDKMLKKCILKMINDLREDPSKETNELRNPIWTRKLVTSMRNSVRKKIQVKLQKC
jgi:hypothetical protein